MSDGDDDDDDDDVRWPRFHYVISHRCTLFQIYPLCLPFSSFLHIPLPPRPLFLVPFLLQASLLWSRGPTSSPQTVRVAGGQNRTSAYSGIARGYITRNLTYHLTNSFTHPLTYSLTRSNAPLWNHPKVCGIAKEKRLDAATTNRSSSN